jgi:predicted GIY-YIG superfamily endonuclease
MDRWVAELATDTARDPEECRQVAEWLRETVMAATAGVEDVRQRVVIAHGVFSYCAAQVRDHQAGEHLVYLLYDGSGSLLYVGITDRGPQRLVEHYRTKPWFHQVARIEFERHVTRDKAAARETKLIRQRHPRFNVIHNRAARVAA